MFLALPRIPRPYTRIAKAARRSSPGTVSYSTSFSATENPISEGSVWSNGLAVAVGWNNVRTTAGTPNKAYAAALAHDGDYDDSIAILSGFPANQSVQATVYLDPTYTAPNTHEIELLLRFQISANFARGYEVDFWAGGSNIQIVKWNGTKGNFDTSLSQSGIGISSLVTGDVVKATAIDGSGTVTINVYKNGTLIWTCTDPSPYTSGNPGIGFFPRTGCDPTKYCFSSFSATGL